MKTSEFQDQEYLTAYPKGMHKHWWNVARNSVISRYANLYIPKDHKILEVGCGTGVVTAHLKKKGWEIDGIDLGTPPAHLLATQSLILGKDALDLPKEKQKSYKAIGLFDVLEHIDKPGLFLDKVFKEFENATHMIATVPARQELWSNYDEHYGHQMRYNTSSTNELLRESGLRPLKMAYFFHSLYPVMRALTLTSRKQRKVELAPPSGGFSSFMHLSVGKALAMDSLMLPEPLIGTSMIFIAEKR